MPDQPTRAKAGAAELFDGVVSERYTTSEDAVYVRLTFGTQGGSATDVSDVSSVIDAEFIFPAGAAFWCDRPVAELWLLLTWQVISARQVFAPMHLFVVSCSKIPRFNCTHRGKAESLRKGSCFRLLFNPRIYGLSLLKTLRYMSLLACVDGASRWILYRQRDFFPVLLSKSIMPHCT